MSFFWRCLATVGYRGHFAYNDMPEGESSDATLHCDPIDVAGTARVKNMMARARLLAFVALLPALTLLTKGDEISKYWSSYDEVAANDENRKRLRETRSRRMRFTDRRYSRVFEELADTTPGKQILVQCTTEEVLFFSTFFTVPKTETTCRVIFNGARLSRMWKSPPAVNIPDLTQILRKVQELEERNEEFIIIQGDYRHWFHQLKVSDELSRHFGLAIEGLGTFRWRTLPMGFSYSPWIAQSAAWLTLLARHTNQKPLFDERAMKGDNLPTFVSSEHGFCTVYYDNFLFVTTSFEEAILFEKRLTQNCADFTVTIKEGSYSRTTMRQASGTTVSFVGISIVMGVEGMRWYPSKVGKWRSEIGRAPELTTCRQVTQILGRVLFDLHISLLPIVCHAHGRRLIQILSTIGRCAYDKGWDSKCPIEDILHEILAMWHVSLERDTDPHGAIRYAKGHHAMDRSEHVLVTDASNQGYGYELLRWKIVDNSRVLLERRGIRVSCSKSFELQWKDKHIYVKEMFSAVEAVKEFSKVFPEEPFILVTDNSAVAFGLKNGFTNNQVGMSLMSSIVQVIPRMEVVLVQSKDNPADCHSRMRFEDYQIRLLRLSLAMKSLENTGQANGGVVEYKMNGTTVRHPEGNGEEDDVYPVDMEYVDEL